MPDASHDGTMSKAQMNVFRSTAILLVIWFCVSILAAFFGDEIYPSLSAPAFIRPKNFDFENITVIEYRVQFLAADRIEVELAPYELLSQYLEGSRMSIFRRLFPIEEKSGMIQKQADGQLWNWLCQLADLSPEAVEEIRVLELRRVVKPESKAALPTGNGIALTSAAPQGFPR